MTRPGGRLVRVTLRLGLLLGGVVAGWGAHEIATVGDAYAADRPAPAHHTPHLFTGTHGPHSGSAPTTVRHRHRPTVDGRTPAPPRRATPNRPPAQAADTPPARHRPAYRPSGQRRADRPPAPSGRPGPSTTAGDPLRPTTRAARVVPTPGPVADPAPPAALRPGADPVGTGVVDRVAGAPRAVTGPLGPIGVPPWHGLKPVLDPLDPVLDPLEPMLKPPKTPKTPKQPPPAQPATDVPSPPTAPPPAQPAVPAPSDDLVGPTSSIRPVTVTAADWAAPSAATRLAPGSAWGTAARGDPVPSRSTRTHGPWPVSPDVAPVPGTNAPGTSGASSAAAGHGELADASAPAWTPPARPGRRCPDASGDALPSRAPRPGTRPA
ncbi:hypothetical protein ACL02O_24065 [Micromonospora sp. MS34]|uniref:hypothetical protein n=1 Tax=Micromonospora sp. MS34 TaxID=3385971 RepID=UPI0039A08A33